MMNERQEHQEHVDRHEYEEGAGEEEEGYQREYLLRGGDGGRKVG